MAELYFNDPCQFAQFPFYEYFPIAMSESGSLTPSQVMSSSHSSSEGSSIGGFVVVDKCSGHFQNSDSCEDGKSSEISAKSENFAQAGSTAESQAELMERVQNLSKENEELKVVLQKNRNLLEVMYNLRKFFFFNRGGF